MSIPEASSISEDGSGIAPLVNPEMILPVVDETSYLIQPGEPELLYENPERKPPAGILEEMEYHSIQEL